jgi:anti-sigma regulatory factor (Ser/Thr protein kinase)
MSLAGIRQGACLFRFLHREERVKEPRPEGHGDELQELAETFGRTVERLSSLVHQLETAHERTLQAEQEKKRFYRDVIRAVTQGRFELVDAGEIPVCGEPLVDLAVTDSQGYAAARKAIQTVAETAGMGEERAGELVLAAGEAITNAMKHAETGRFQVYRSPDALSVRITDQGAGIRSEDLPAAILLPGFSTKVSLGMGYTLMLKLCDRVWLSTGPEGTIIQLEKKLEAAPEAPSLPWLPEGLLGN